MAYSALIFCLTESPLVEKARTPGKWSVYFAPFPASNMIYFDSIMTPVKITLSTARCRSPAGICSRGHKSRESGPYLRAWSGGGDSRSWSPSPEQLHSSNSSQRTHAHTHTYTPNHEFFLHSLFCCCQTHGTFRLFPYKITCWPTVLSSYCPNWHLDSDGWAVLCPDKTYIL